MKKLTAIVLLLCVLLTSCNKVPDEVLSKETSSQFVPVTTLYGTKYEETRYYGYSQLNDKQKEFFDAFEEIFKLETPVGTEIKVSAIDVDERIVASDLFSRTHQSLGYWELQPPEYDNVVIDGKSYSETVFSTKRFRAKKNEQRYYDYMDKAEQIISQMPKSLNDYEKCLYISQWLCDNVYYDNYTNPDTYNPELADMNSRSGYGALVKGKAICTGYAEAFDLLAKKSGINSILISGDTINGYHCWNMVQIDGYWYHIDTTWMDTKKQGTYNYHYFMADDAQMLPTHPIIEGKDDSRAYSFMIDPPVADSTALNWYRMNDLWFNTADEALTFINNLSYTNNKTKIRLDSKEELEKVKEIMAGPEEVLVTHDGEEYILAYIEKTIDEYNPANILTLEFIKNYEEEEVRPLEYD
jgi:hypothetical protein